MGPCIGNKCSAERIRPSGHGECKKSEASLSNRCFKGGTLSLLKRAVGGE